MNRHGRKIPSFILMTLLMSFLIVSAACAETVVSERLDVDGTPSWPPGVAVTIKVGPVRSSYGKPMLIEGYTINNEAINTAGYLGSVAFISHDDGRGAVLAQLTINNASGTHNLLVAVRNRSFLIDQCTVNFAENSQGAPYIWAYSEGGSGTIQKTTFTGNGGNNNVVLRVGGTNNNDDLAGGEITLSGVTYHNINGQFRLQGPLNIAAGETVLIEERETVLSNSTITAHTKSHETAKITINEGAKLSVRSSTFDLLQKPSIVVKSGATLEVNNAELKNMTITGEPGSTITFSGKKNSLDHVVINTKGKVTSGKTEIVFKNGSEINLMESTDPAVFDETTMELGGNGSTVFLSIAKNREASIKNGSKVINGSGTAGNMTEKGFITVDGKLNILKSTISDNTITAGAGVRSQGSVIRVNQDGELNIAEGSSFKNNNVQGGFGGAIRLVKAKSLTIDGATFTGNQALHGGAIRMEGVGTVKISKATFTDNLAGTGASGGAIDGREVTMSITGTEFSGNGAAENAATNHGGALAIYESTVSLDGCTFQSNRGNYGGALLHKGGELTIKGSEFSENSGVWGGAVTVEGDFPWDDSWSAENPPQETVEATSRISLDISGTTFDRNTATTCGGALALGFEYGGYYSTKDVIQATIGGGTSFTNNSVSDCTVGEAGGAIFLNNDATLRMNRVAIYGNTAQDDGGAISNCPNGATIVNVRNGAAIYDNYVGSDGNLYRRDLMMGHTENPHVIGEIMFNGGLHRWNPPVSDMIAEHYTSDPEEKYKNPAGAQVSFTGNSAMDTGGNITRGGAIGNNGVLIIGDAGTWVEITKYWDDDQNLKNGKKYSDLFRPEMEDFLRSLQVYRVDSENNRLPMLNWDRAVFQKIGSGESAYWLVTNLGIF